MLNSRKMEERRNNARSAQNDLIEGCVPRLSALFSMKTTSVTSYQADRGGGELSAMSGTVIQITTGECQRVIDSVTGTFAWSVAVKAADGDIGTRATWR